MAEGISRHWLEGGQLGDPSELFFASAGVAAIEGLPTSLETLHALARLGIEHQGISKPLSADMIRRADVVLCITSHHENAARMLVLETEHTEKIQRLDPEADLGDPMGRGQGAYDALASRLMQLIPKRLEEILKHETGPGK
jgi:protein-tyrosine-phosphatase